VAVQALSDSFAIHAKDVGPVIALQSFNARQTPIGASVQFSVYWQAYADSFSIERSTGGGTWALLEKLPANPYTGRVAYEVYDPLGTTGDYYRLTEHQTGTRGDLTY